MLLLEVTGRVKLPLLHIGAMLLKEGFNGAVPSPVNEMFTELAPPPDMVILPE